MSDASNVIDLDPRRPDCETKARRLCLDVGLPSAVGGQAHSTSGETIPVCRPLLPTRKSLLGYLDFIDGTRHYSNHGPLVLLLQGRLRARTAGTAHVALASSGTAALAGAILATAGRADPLRPLCLLPAYTFIGTVSAVEQAGFVPYFVDVDPETWMLDPQACRDHPALDRVGLVVPVAPYGRPVPQADWEVFRSATGVPVAIDGAAAIEGLFSKPDITLGSVPVATSFHATKVFCTGEGGGVFCSDLPTWRAAIECLNFGYNLGRLSGRPSINGKMSEYHAAVGLAEAEDWSEKLRLYAVVANFYREHGAGLICPMHFSPSVASSYALVETAGAEQAHALMLALTGAGIGCRKWYGGGAHRQPYCQRFDRDRLPHSESLADRLVGLPMAVDLQSDAVRDVVSVLRYHEKSITRQ